MANLKIKSLIPGLEKLKTEFLVTENRPNIFTRMEKNKRIQIENKEL